MIVCHCTGKTDRDIRQEMSKGCRSVGEATASCGAGGQCGGCIKTIQSIIQTGSQAAVSREKVRKA